MNNKITETIVEISGIRTNPFRRYVNNIPLLEFLDILDYERTIAHMKGYYNLQLAIRMDAGIIDIDLVGDREKTIDELNVEDHIAAIFRMKEKTKDGLTRDDLINRSEYMKLGKYLVRENTNGSIIEVNILDISNDHMKIQYASGVDEWVPKNEFNVKYTIKEFLAESRRGLLLG
jgi:hypothetical protein